MIGTPSILRLFSKVFKEVDGLLGKPEFFQFTEDPTMGTPQSVQLGSPHLLLSTLSQSVNLTKLGNTRKERKGERIN